MSEDLMKMLKEITEAAGVSGYEKEIKEVTKSYLKDSADLLEDRLGSLIFKKEGGSQSPRVMLAAHMDEIGFMVKNITKDGFIKFIPLGGWWDQVLLSQRVVIHTEKEKIIGVIGSKPPHILTEEEARKVVEKKQMYIDVGATNEEEVLNMGVRPGDPITPYSEFTVMANSKMLLAKAWDDRVGCALLIEVIKELKNSQHPNSVYTVATVQEEVGLRGATTSSYVVDPDVAIVLESDIATDMPGINEEKKITLGKGPSIILYDATMIPNPNLRRLFIETADSLNIPIQFSALERGGTDGGRIHIHAKGVPSIVISVPARYIHSHTSIINIDDFLSAKKLILEVIKKLDRETVESL
ncbi:MAG TPA: M42 family metallopeptidase [Dictyoglomaceae bacterium]|nr:M42 family metallopeptidase [Dictyoglomaceae bacterium]HOL39136.1 M42 family metallopeptidase [Dictyoglomaceae bacterium]HOP94255.1 M42 family metallopeptidase [Dictyoglomaceae bacterium]HPP15290.1 M42 family metallopeptidase [Dictyoglomaceae bacterium]HPU42696.1 M42 family metallopeptidase [Dictyoglomaceae bacterium]